MIEKEMNFELFAKVIDRIQSLFSVGKEHIGYASGSAHEYHLFRVPRSTQLLSSLRIPGIGLKNENKVSHSEKKPLFVQLDLPEVSSEDLDSLDLSALHTEELCTEEKELFLSVLTSLLDSQQLSPERFKNVKIKEHLVALTKIQRPEEQKVSPKEREIFVFAKKPENEDDETSEKWREYLEQKEERQFNITRVIRFLST